MKGASERLHHFAAGKHTISTPNNASTTTHSLTHLLDTQELQIGNNDVMWRTYPMRTRRATPKHACDYKVPELVFDFNYMQRGFLISLLQCWILLEQKWDYIKRRGMLVPYWAVWIFDAFSAFMGLVSTHHLRRLLCHLSTSSKCTTIVE